MSALAGGCVESDGARELPSPGQASERADQLVYFVRSEEAAHEVREPLRERIGWILLPAPRTAPTTASGTDAAEAVPPIPAVQCGECHPTNYEGFLETAHARTSASADIGNFQAPPTEAGTTIPTRVPGFSFHVRRRGNEVEQIVRVDLPEGTYRHRERADIIMGSGKYGQTYLYWKYNHLYQLPVSYLTYDDSWGLSPGYVDGTADFARPITSRCVDCHATSAVRVAGSTNAFDKESLLLGVYCVRCHGDLHEHVAWHREHPDEVVGRYITSPSELTARQMNDLCAQCHSGAGELLKPAFSYRPGDDLGEYLDRGDEEPAEHDDPHSANQLQRLRQSACFQKSDWMTCVTCHNPHRHERNQPLLFAERCLDCHQTLGSACPNETLLGDAAWRQNCIRCHMPSKHDLRTVTQIVERRTTPRLRDHRIAIWKDVSTAVRDEILSAKPK